MAASTTIAAAAQNSGPRPMVCGPSRREIQIASVDRRSSPVSATSVSTASFGLFILPPRPLDPGRKAAGQYPDYDDHGDEKPDLTEELTIPRRQAGADHRENGRGRGGPDKDVRPADDDRHE